MFTEWFNKWVKTKKKSIAPEIILSFLTKEFKSSLIIINALPFICLILQLRLFYNLILTKITMTGKETVH